jgi:hypothetical protein
MFLLSIFSWLACSPCKQLCSDMAKIAEDECGYTITREMFTECKNQQSDKDKDGRKECRLAAPSLEEEWDCDELSIYFEENTSNESDANDTGS